MKTVEGLKLSITTQQLKKLCEQRVEYHSNRAAFCAERTEREKKNDSEMEHLNEEAVEQFKYTNSQVVSRADTWAQQVKRHTDRATVFKFMGAHLVPGATYILGEDDLQKLEVLPRW